MKIVIAEDQGMLRGAFSQLLSLEKDIEIVGEAGNGEQALQLIHTKSPDIAILDIEMPLLSGLGVAEKLRKEGNTCRIVIVTTFGKTGYFQRAVRSNAQGYLLKDSPISELTEALRKIYSGGKVFNSHLTFSIMEEKNPLTDRQLEILFHLKEDYTVHEISKLLFLSPGTIRNYISEVLQKLEAKNRIDAVAIRSKERLDQIKTVKEHGKPCP